MLRGGIKQSADVRAIGAMLWQCWVNVETMWGECFGCFTGSLHQSRFACLTFILRSTGFGEDVSYVYSPNGLYPGDLTFLPFLRTETLTELSLYMLVFCLSKGGGLRKGNTSPYILFFRPLQECRWQTFIEKTNQDVAYINSKKVPYSPQSSHHINNGAGPIM